jgi:Smg protein|tara:strand:- start:360 stop:821 length:462 start_codon:yes stop_codon:yes gene_type:complete
MFDLLIYMFENYLSSKNNLDFTNMTLELEAAGFNNKDIESALDWFSELKEMSVKIPQSQSLKLNDKLRIFTENEKSKFSFDGLGFILFLEQAHVLNSIEREIIIDRAMALNQNIISIDEVRWIVMMTLWNNGRENDYLFVEDALYQTEQSMLH